MRSAKRSTMAAAAAAALLLVACGGGSDDAADDGAGSGGSAVDAGDTPTPSTPRTAATAPAADEYDREASFTWASQTYPTNLSPHVGSFSGGNVPVFTPLHDRLVYLNPFTGQLEPMLAESWEASDDATSLTLQLRDDVTYHDGTPFDAASVVANVEHAKSLGSEHPRVAEYNLIEGAVAVDEHTVRYDLTGAYAGAMPTLLAGGLGMNVAPDTLGNTDPTKVVGTGPYQIAEVRPGQSYRMTRYDGYWNPEWQNFAELNIVVETSEETILNGIAAGQFDAGRVSPAVKARAEQTPNVQVVSELGNTAQVMGMNIARIEGAENPDVRLAINTAIDREALANGALRGECVATVQPWSAAHPAHHPDYPADYYGADPEKARQLLADAGYPDGISFEIDTYTNPAYIPIAEVLKSQLAEAGIEVEIKQLDSAVLGTGYRTEKTLDTWLTRTPYGAPPVETITNTWLAGSSGNPGNFSDPVIEELYPQVMAEIDPDAQNELLKQIAARLVEAPSHSLILCHEYSLWLGTDDVLGLAEPLTGYQDFHRLGIRAS